MNWIDAVARARRELRITGFVAVKKGSALYKRAKQLHSGASPKRRSPSPKRRSPGRR